MIAVSIQTEAEQKRIIGADFEAKRDTDRNLACLESKRGSIKKNIGPLSRALDGSMVLDSVSENTLHTHDGAVEGRPYQSVVVPSAKEEFALAREISDTKHEISPIEQRLAKVQT